MGSAHNDHMYWPEHGRIKLPAKGTYLFDGCPRCDEHSRTLYDLDDGTIQWLAEKADLMVDNNPKGVARTFDLSMNERRAITKLRLYARITFRSQITEEAAN